MPEIGERTLARSRRATVARCLRDLFDLCRGQCICPDGACGLKSPVEWSPEEGAAQNACRQADRCEVCSLFEEQRGQPQLYLSVLSTKNQRLNQLLRLSSAVDDMYEWAATPHRAGESERDQKTRVKELLLELLDCGENRLNCVRNVGALSKLLPRLPCVQLDSGFSSFWTEMRKIAAAVIHQSTPSCQLAAILAFRRKLPPTSPWAFYLSTGKVAEEAHILQGWLDAEITGTTA